MKPSKKWKNKEKIQLAREKLDIEKIVIFYHIEKLRDNSEHRIIRIQKNNKPQHDKLRNVLASLDISHLVNGKIFVNSLNFKEMEIFSFDKHTTFDDFMQNAVLQEYSTLYINNKLESKLEAKSATKQLKI